MRGVCVMSVGCWSTAVVWVIGWVPIVVVLPVESDMSEEHQLVEPRLARMEWYIRVVEVSIWSIIWGRMDDHG